MGLWSWCLFSFTTIFSKSAQAQHKHTTMSSPGEQTTGPATTGPFVFPAVEPTASELAMAHEIYMRAQDEIK